MEMVTIDKKAAIPVLNQESKVDKDRRCGNCGCANETKDWCQLHRHCICSINYGCKTWMSPEELDARLREKQAYLDSENGIRVNYMLTLMFAFVTAAYQIMIRGECILGELIGGKDWRFERKKALNDIMSDIGHIQSLYSTYFEKDYIQMMSNYGREEFDRKKYDGFQMYAGDVLMVGLELLEHCYHKPELIREVIKDIRKMPNDLNLFSPEFVDQFQIKVSK